MATHVIMKKSLAKALMDAGVEHYDDGGVMTGANKSGGLGGAISNFVGGQNKLEAFAPTITTQDFLPKIDDLEKKNDTLFDDQHSLAQALLAQSKGEGPNPALKALAQATGANAANTAATIASTRGATANPALAARIAAEQGANAQQQSVGQAATLQAQQTLGQQSAAAEILNNLGGQNLQGQSVQQSGLAAQNSAQTTGQLGATQANAQIAAANASAAQHMIGSIFNPLGSIFYKGGKVEKFADGGIATYAAPIDPHVVLNIAPLQDDESKAKSKGQPGSEPATDPLAGYQPTMGEPGGIAGLQGDAPAVGGDAIDAGGAMDAASSGLVADAGAAAAGEAAMDVGALTAAGTAAAGASAAELAPLLLLASSGGEIDDFRPGGPVPGTANVKGDSPKNDTVPALLSPGEAVLPRSVTTAPDAPERAKRFVQALRDKEGNGDDYAKVLKAKATLKDRVARLEKLCMGGRAA